MIELIIHPEVIKDVTLAAAYYNEIDPELGAAFSTEAYRAIGVAQSSPQLYPLFFEGCRRVPCRRFPYRVIYEELLSERAVHVLAVFHDARHPDAWKTRRQ